MNDDCAVMNDDCAVMNTLHTHDAILKQRAEGIAKEISAVKLKSKDFARKLGLSKTVIESIHKQYKSDDCLLYIIEEFVKQDNPIPTWRVILDALESHDINERQLAQRCKNKHCLRPEAKDGMS